MNDIFKKEIENLAHTLNDIRTVIECSKLLLKEHKNLVNRLEPRIDVLQTRIDFLTINP